MYKRKLYIIIMILIILLILLGCSDQRTTIKQNADRGIIDLTQLQFDNDVISLDGQWEFYWNQLLAPGEAKNGKVTEYIQIPSSWNKCIGNEDHSGYGYATYRLLFKTDENMRLALKVPRLFTAYKLWIKWRTDRCSRQSGQDQRHHDTPISSSSCFI